MSDVVRLTKYIEMVSLKPNEPSKPPSPPKTFPNMNNGYHYSKKILKRKKKKINIFMNNGVAKPAMNGIYNHIFFFFFIFIFSFLRNLYLIY